MEVAGPEAGRIGTMPQTIEESNAVAPPRTIAQKVWDRHVVRSAPGEPDLLYIDLHLVHEVTSPQAFDGLRLNGRTVRRPDLSVATIDHNNPTTGLDRPIEDPVSARQMEVLAENTAAFGIRFFGIGSPDRGIVHVIGPEQGLTLPGMTIVCGDSHTSTHGAFGALAFGIGTSEVEHVLATQTLPQARPRTMSVTVDGDLPRGVTAKDVVLSIIATIGTGGGIGSIIEYRGSAIRALSMEGRMTVCNMSIEAGARAGLIAPDDTTFEYLEGRRFAPRGSLWEAALDDWRTLPTDDGAVFDHEVVLDTRSLRPSVSWGTNPAQTVTIDDVVPDPSQFDEASLREVRDARAALHGPEAGDADPRDRRRHRVHRLVHERAARGSPRCRRGPARSQGARRPARPRRPGVDAGQGRRGGRGPRRCVHRGRLRVARARVARCASR